jgi:rhodanese-related sulfurtransferase
MLQEFVQGAALPEHWEAVRCARLRLRQGFDPPGSGCVGFPAGLRGAGCAIDDVVPVFPPGRSAGSFGRAITIGRIKRPCGFRTGSESMKKSLTPDELRLELASAKPPLVIDVRRVDDHDSAPEGIPGADWRAPVLLEDWAGGIPAKADVVVYCVRGGQVSQEVQAALTERGVTARYLEGGLAAWAATEKKG